MPGSIRTKTWKQPREEGDGTRLLVTRYRPRGVRKEDETWDEWEKELGPSKELHAAWFGKRGEPIAWEEFVRRYRQELGERAEVVEAVGERVRGGETVTLLCYCEDEGRCHRSLLAGVLEDRVGG